MNVLRKIAALDFTTIQPCWNSILDDKFTSSYRGVRLLKNNSIVGEFFDYGINDEVKELFTHVFDDTYGKIAIRNNLEIMEAFFQKGKHTLGEMLDCSYSKNLDYFSHVITRLVNARELKGHLTRGKSWTQAVEKLKSSTNNERQLADLAQLQEFLDLVVIVRDKTKTQTSISSSDSDETKDEWTEVLED